MVSILNHVCSFIRIITKSPSELALVRESVISVEETHLASSWLLRHPILKVRTLIANIIIKLEIVVDAKALMFLAEEDLDPAKVLPRSGEVGFLGSSEEISACRVFNPEPPIFCWMFRTLDCAELLANDLLSQNPFR